MLLGLDNLQKLTRRTVDFTLAGSLEPWAHRQDVASLSFFYRYYFGRCSSEMTALFLFPYSPVRSTLYSTRLHDLS